MRAVRSYLWCPAGYSCWSRRSWSLTESQWESHWAWCSTSAPAWCPPSRTPWTRRASWRRDTARRAGSSKNVWYKTFSPFQPLVRCWAQAVSCVWLVRTSVTISIYWNNLVFISPITRLLLARNSRKYIKEEDCHSLKASWWLKPYTIQRLPSRYLDIWYFCVDKIYFSTVMPKSRLWMMKNITYSMGNI